MLCQFWSGLCVFKRSVSSGLCHPHTAITVASDRRSISVRPAAGLARLHFYTPPKKTDMQARTSIFLFYRARCDITTQWMVGGGANDGSGLNAGEKRRSGVRAGGGLKRCKHCQM